MDNKWDLSFFLKQLASKYQVNLKWNTTSVRKEVFVWECCNNLGCYYPKDALSADVMNISLHYPCLGQINTFIKKQLIESNHLLTSCKLSASMSILVILLDKYLRFALWRLKSIRLIGEILWHKSIQIVLNFFSIWESLISLYNCANYISKICLLRSPQLNKSFVSIEQEFIHPFSGEIWGKSVYPIYLIQNWKFSVISIYDRSYFLLIVINLSMSKIILLK